MNLKLVVFSKVFFVFILAFTSIAATAVPQTSEALRPPTRKILKNLGGYPCFDGSAFTCVTIQVPLDHFNLNDTRTIDVTFAVLPASGKRKGMFVTATGGPGYSGVMSADYYLYGYAPSILKSFDIVFFDQRGLLFSGDQTCPMAGSAYYQHDARGKTSAQKNALKQSANTFSEDCVNEVTDPGMLPYLGTKQAVEDLEYFRQLMKDNKFWLYGESYGTQYAQTYAAKYSDHLAGLILDGTVDLTHNGFEFYQEQAQAFNDTLTATLSACNEDPACQKDMLGDAVKAYDRLAWLLNHHPIDFNYPLPEGGFAKRQFTFTNLEFVAASQMYNESDRMMFIRALAAFTSKLDIIPLARLLYLDLGLDPQTLDIIPDPAYSDAVYYGVECQDYGYPGITPEEKADTLISTVNPFEYSIPRLASIIYGDLPCAYWPSATTDLTRPNYLFAENVPTLVLGATADPATPVNHGIQVYEHLANAYLIVQDYGPHVIYGRGNECPDALVTNFLVKNIMPSERETRCDGYLVDAHVPLAPRFAVTFQTPYNALSSVETEIYHLPEFYYWYDLAPTAVGCTYGGTLKFESNNAGTKYTYTLDQCALTYNFIMTGTGTYNANVDHFALDVNTTGRWTCGLKYTRTGEKVSVLGACDGETLNSSQKDVDRDWHNLPDLKKPKEFYK